MTRWSNLNTVILNRNSLLTNLRLGLIMIYDIIVFILERGNNIMLNNIKSYDIKKYSERNLDAIRKKIEVIT